MNAINAKKTVNIKNFDQNSYIEIMSTPGNGIYAEIVALDATKIKVDSVEAIIDNLDVFLIYDAGVLFNYYIAGEEGVRRTLARIIPFNLTAEKLRLLVQQEMKPSDLVNPGNVGYVSTILTDLLLLAAGATVEVKFDENNSFYNIAYHPSVVKSGRTYSWPKPRGVIDPSDNYFLTELQNLPTIAMDDFYKDINNMFLFSQFPTNFSTNSNRYLFNDFFAVYTAELIRFLMVGYRQDPWATDITQVLYLSAYVNSSQMIIHKGKFIHGNVNAFYGRGKHGSGIGDTRNDFTALSKQITTYIKTNHNDVSKQIYQFVSVQTDDLLRDIATFFSNQKYINEIKQGAAKLQQILPKIYQIMYKENNQITEYIKNNI